MFIRMLSTIGIVGLYLLAFFGTGVATYRWVSSYIFDPLKPNSKEQVLFEVKSGYTLERIGQALEQQQLIKSKHSIQTLAQVKKQAREISVGEYSLSPSMTPNEILDHLLSKKVVTHEIVVPSGVTVRQVPDLIAATKLVTRNEVEAALNDQNLLENLKIPSYSFEGYLFPDSQAFSKPITAKQILTVMVNKGRSNLDKQIGGWEKRAAELGLNEYQVITLASIIEKEARKPEDKRRVSSVYHNRLRIGMPLQSDATVAYGLPDLVGKPTTEHRNTPGPYNTYLNTGLPGTPICSPNLDSIKAALNPEDTDYLYFVELPDGTYKFSATYKDHLAALKDAGM